MTEASTSLLIPRRSFPPRKNGGPIVKAELQGPKNGLPGTELDVAMPSAGEYETEVTFFKNLGGQSRELTKASFNFSAVALSKTKPADAATAPTADVIPNDPHTNTVPRYIWALILFFAGTAIGRFSAKIYKWAFSN